LIASNTDFGTARLLHPERVLRCSSSDCGNAAALRLSSSGLDVSRHIGVSIIDTPQRPSILLLIGNVKQIDQTFFSLPIIPIPERPPRV
jgi:hypothetical protein